MQFVEEIVVGGVYEYVRLDLSERLRARVGVGAVTNVHDFRLVVENIDEERAEPVSYEVINLALSPDQYLGTGFEGVVGGGRDVGA